MRPLGSFLLLFAITAVVLSACSSSEDIRYRLTINLVVDGEEKTASSVINTNFYGCGSKSGPYHCYARTTGVAPVIDLGRHGWLVAAMQLGSDGDRRCRNSVEARFLIDAFYGHELRGKRALSPKHRPPFIWFPPDKPYTSAQQICPEIFQQVIAPDVEFKSATIEIVPKAQVKTRLEFDASWLEEMRVDQLDGHDGKHGIFKPNLWHVEAPGVVGERRLERERANRAKSHRGYCSGELKWGKATATNKSPFGPCTALDVAK